MDKNRLIYNARKGIGVVTGKEPQSGFYKVVFLDESEKFLEKVDYLSPEWWDLLSDTSKIEKHFSRQTYQRGSAYFSDGRITNIKYESDYDILSATVRGTHRYTASAQIHKNSFFMYCTCPVGNSCKHCAALMIMLADFLKKHGCSEEIQDPETNREREIALPFTFSPTMEEVLNRVSESTSIPDIFQSVRLLTDKLAEKSVRDSDIPDLLRRLENMQYRHRDTFHLIDIAFATDRRINSFLDGFLKFKTDLWRAHANVLRMTAGYRLPEKYKKVVPGTDICSAIAFSSVAQLIQYTETGLITLLTDKKIAPDYTDYFFRFFTDRIHDEKRLKNIILSVGGEFVIGNTVALKLIHSSFPLDFWKDLIQRYDNRIKADGRLISDFSVEERFALIPFVEDESFAVDFVLDNLYPYIPDYADDTAFFVEKIHYSSFSREKKDKIQKILSGMPDSEYFRLYIENNKHPNLTDMETVPYNFEHLLRYFSLSLEAREEDDCCRIVLNVNGKSGCLLDLLFDDKFEQCFQMYGYFVTYMPVAISGNPFLTAFVPDIRKKFEKEIAEKVSYVKNKIEERKQKELYEEMQASLTQLSDLLYSRKIQVLPAQRSTLSFSFSEEYSFDGSYLTTFLSAKISNGRGKFYVLKNFSRFLENFENHETEEYGKGFELTHMLSNFDESSQKAISLLQGKGTGIYAKSDKRYISLSAYTVNDILATLVGKNIFWDGDEYTVRFHRSAYAVSLDKNDVMTFPLSSENHKLLQFNDVLYDFNKESGVIDIIEGTEETQRLLLFAFKHNGQSIRPVLDKFKTDIYPRLARHIEVDSERVEEFKLGNITVNAYFDYTDKVLSVQTVLTKDGKTVSEKEPSTLGDKAVYENYLNYIRMLGFTEECPENAVHRKADAWMDNEASVLSFFSMDFTELKKYCTVYLSDSIQNKVLLTFQPPVIRIRYESGIMQAFAENTDFSDEELDAVLQAIRLKKKYILLSDNRIVRLDNDEAEEFSDTVNDLGLNEKAITAPQPIPISTSIRALAHEANCLVDDYLTSMINDIKSFKLSKLPLPQVQAELRSYQKEGFRWLKILSSYKMGGVLADDMGLGKTLEMITLLKSDDESRPSLIVCPKSLIYNWKTEFEKFDGETEVSEIYGNASVREEIISAIDYEKKRIYITSYDSLRNDREKYTGVFNYLILDEAQYIKNIHAQKSQSVKNVSAVRKFALTGTPIENNVLDLWSIFDFILPGYFENLKVFKHRYETDSRFPEIISKRVSPFILRRTKKDVLKDLPEKFERILSAEMTPEQRKLYEAYKKTARGKMQSGGKAFDILPILTRLRQICVDPSMFTEEYAGGSGKLNLLAELFPEYITAGHRILLFSQFVKGLESVEKLLRELHIPYYKLTGDTQTADRMRLVNEFNNGKTVNIFLISLKAGGTGLNLIGADTVIHLDPWWNVSAENQATDRSHRIGQTKNVEVIKIICSDSVEQKVIDLQNKKKDLVDRLIANDDSSVTGATLEDIAFVIE